MLSLGTKRKAAGIKSLQEHSVSSVAKDEASAVEYIKRMPVYAHWFAVELLQIVECARSQLTTYPLSELTTMEFSVGTQKIEIDKARLKLACKSIKKVCGLVETSELNFSALIACHLDRFLFGGEDAHLGYCLHQGPTRKRPKTSGSPEAPDIYVCSCDDRSYGFPVAFGSVKLNDPVLATTETGLYCSTSAQIQKGMRKSPIYIGMPCSRTQLILQVYMEEVDGRMWQIPVYSSFLYCQELLCSLFCGIHFLIQSHYFNRSPMEKPCPLFGKNLVPLTDQDDCRVYLEEASRTVIKFYDLHSGKFSQKPNLQLLHLFPGKLEAVAADLCMLKYSYIEGGHEPNRLRQFSGVVRDLSKLHAAGFVHGDVRLMNIVFQKNTSYLIDYDLASKEGSSYPCGYNHHFKERHLQALGRWPMCKQHDRHSLLFLMKKVAKTQAELAIVKDLEIGMDLEQVAEKIEILESLKKA